jgi:hypothetical protein
LVTFYVALANDAGRVVTVCVTERCEALNAKN